MVKISSRGTRVASAMSGTKLKRTFSINARRDSKAVIRNAIRNSSPSTGAKNVRGVVIGGPQGPERKKYETSNTAGVQVSTGFPYVQSLTNGIAQGAGVSNRIGDRIHVKGVDLQFNITAGAGITIGAQEFVDVFLVLDTQPQQTTAAAGTIFETPSTNLTYVDLDSLQRFQILKRERIHFDTAGGLSHQMTWHQSCELACRFDNATAAPMSNDLLVCALSPSSNTAGQNPNVAYIARLSFTDA